MPWWLHRSAGRLTWLSQVKFLGGSVRLFAVVGKLVFDFWGG